MNSDPFSDAVKSFFSDPTRGLFNALKWINFFDDSEKMIKIWESIRISFMVADAIVIAAFVGVFVAAFKYRPHLRPEYTPHKKTFTLRDAVLKERWEKIKVKIQSGTPDALRIAIIEADKFTDDVLKKMGLGGEHMADRLEKISAQEIRSLTRLWDAHRLRNNLVHTPGFQVSASEAKKALEDYEAFLKEIKVLQ